MALTLLISFFGRVSQQIIFLLKKLTVDRGQEVVDEALMSLGRLHPGKEDSSMNRMTV
jgi:hypothetical protein